MRRRGHVPGQGGPSDFDTYESALDDGVDRLKLMEELRDAMAER